MTNPKIIKLIENILLHFANKEDTSIVKKYFTFYDEQYDHYIGRTEFQNLSSQNIIVLSCSLNYVDVMIIMVLFESIISSDYVYFEFFDDYFDNYINETDKILLASYDDYEIWIKYLTNHFTDFSIINENNLHVHTDKPPVINYNIFLLLGLTPPQSIYNINDILNLSLNNAYILK
jgi:hypothetical protein